MLTFSFEGLVRLQLAGENANQRFFCIACHSGLDPESSVLEIDVRFRGNDSCAIRETLDSLHSKLMIGVLY